MADGRPIHGKNAYIYVSGVAIIGANAWNAATTKEVVDTPQFGDTWKRKVWGQLDGNGNIQAWMHQDKRTLRDAVAADGPVLTYIYPDRADTTNYISADLIFTNHAADGATGAGVSGNVDFTTYDGTNGLLYTGFA